MEITNEEYPFKEKLINLCKSFENQEITISATFMGKTIPIYNCNIVGGLLEDVFYPLFKEELPDFEKGPKQLSPDYYGNNKKYEFELKAFMIHPCFDIGNFTSYINGLCEIEGVKRKLFNTNYLIFEYTINNNIIKIIHFHYMNVYNLISHKNKYPISMQVKKNIWYNIRPDCVNNWYSKSKTPQLFIDKIIECIILCPHIEDKQNKITNITTQMEGLKRVYTF